MKNKKPNILLITSDQQHWHTLGKNNPVLKTPTLDRLCDEGTRFERAYCPHPTCTPSRCSIITGLYPSQHGAWALGTRLDEKIPTLGGFLKDAGYHTSLIGKAHFQPTKSTEKYPGIESKPEIWDLDFYRKFSGPFYGFDHIALLRNHNIESNIGMHYAAWLEDHGPIDWKKYFPKPFGELPEKGPRPFKWDLPEAYHPNTWLVHETNLEIKKQVDVGDPFFVWTSFPDPHPPYSVSAPWDKLYDPELIEAPDRQKGEHDLNPDFLKKTGEPNANFGKWTAGEGNAIPNFSTHYVDKAEMKKRIAVYYGMISFIDDSVGKILSQLDTLGVADNTIIIYTTDHGHFFGQHGLTNKGPFHYEDMLKIPFIVRYPGVVPTGKTSSALQSLVDIAPTLLDICGLDVPQTMSGISQRNSWADEKKSCRDHVLIEDRRNEKKFELLTYVDRRYKISVQKNDEQGLLFDLDNDPGELKNLWLDEAHQGLKIQLLEKLISARMMASPKGMPRISNA